MSYAYLFKYIIIGDTGKSISNQDIIYSRFKPSTWQNAQRQLCMYLILYCICDFLQPQRYFTLYLCLWQQTMTPPANVL